MDFGSNLLLYLLVGTTLAARVTLCADFSIQWARTLVLEAMPVTAPNMFKTLRATALELVISPKLLLDQAPAGKDTLATRFKEKWAIVWRSATTAPVLKMKAPLA